MQLPKDLPKDPLHAVSLNRLAHPPGDDDSQPARAPTACNQMEREQAAAPLPTLFQDVGKLLGSADSHLRPESLRCHRVIRQGESLAIRLPLLMR